MIKVSVLYPKTAASTFDMGYYLKSHIPMIRETLAPAIRNVAVEEGVGGGAPGSAPTYAVMCHLYFDSVDAFQKAFDPHAGPIMGDIANYTNVQPIVQISEVKIAATA